MKDFIKDELYNLDEQLDELLDKSEIILGYKSYNINEVVNDLYHNKDDISKSLAIDILDNRDEYFLISENYEFDNDNSNIEFDD